MIKLEGTLKTKVIHGRNGDFTVGTLLTHIGEFSVKDPMLEQYSEGEYSGEFIVSKIFPSSYTWGGAVRVEIRAVLDSVSIVESQEKTMPSVLEPDPIDEAQASQKNPVSVQTEQPKLDQGKPEKTKPLTDSTVNQGVFGDIQVTNQSGDEVKLDPLVDRQLFRQQRDELRKLGYTFDVKRQLWIK